MFKRAIVLDVISHPSVLSNSIVDKLLNNKSSTLYRVKKKEVLKDLPRNSIIATFDNDQQQIFVALPFFSSHLSLPIKPNEEVWIYEDTGKNQQDSIEFFWVSRIHGFNFIEDVNYTHADRRFLKNYNADDFAKVETKEKIPLPIFNNGPIRNMFNLPSGDSLLRSKDIKVKPSLNISGKWLMESVPRFTKDPGDYVIQGSNNTLIKLGTNKARKNVSYNEKYSNTLAFSEVDDNSGTIDIVAGRCGIAHSLLTTKIAKTHESTDKNFTTFVAQDVYKNAMFSIYNEKNVLENMKDNKFYLGIDNQNIAEGDADFYTDISRLYVSARCNGDELLTLNDLVKVDKDGLQTSIAQVGKRGFIIGKSDEIRFVARSQVFNRSLENKLLSRNNEGLLDTPSSGSIKLIKEGSSGDDRAYISLDYDGAITIDGPMIVIGDKSREAAENGKGTNIYLGNDAKEPGVLGYMLKNKIENFMDETIRALNIIGLCLKDLDSHVHQYAGPSGITLPPQKGNTPSSIDLFSTTENGSFSNFENPEDNAAPRPVNNENGEYGPIADMSVETSKKLSDKIVNLAKIRDSLGEILSKMVKTN